MKIKYIYLLDSVYLIKIKKKGLLLKRFSVLIVQIKLSNTIL